MSKYCKSPTGVHSSWMVAFWNIHESWLEIEFFFFFSFVVVVVGFLAYSTVDKNSFTKYRKKISHRSLAILLHKTEVQFELIWSTSPITSNTSFLDTLVWQWSFLHELWDKTRPSLFAVTLIEPLSTKSLTLIYLHDSSRRKQERRRKESNKRVVLAL